MRKQYLAPVVLISAWLSLPSHAQIYKCTIDGRVVFSDTGCAHDAVAIDKPKVNVLGGQAPANDVAPVDTQVETERASLPPSEPSSDCVSMSSQEIRKRVIQNKVFVGMREADVIKSWGKPTRINRSSHGSDQWVYDRGVGAQYVYIGDEGCVTAWN